MLNNSVSNNGTLHHSKLKVKGFIQLKSIDMVLSEYISEAEGKKIIYHWVKTVKLSYNQEKTIPKAHLVHERRRRNLKKHRHKCLTDFLFPSPTISFKTYRVSILL